MKLSIITQDAAYPTLRRWPRFSVELPLRVYSYLPPSVHEGRGTALNVGGMAVNTTAALRVGDQISVEFTPPGATHTVVARCFVRNCSWQVYGVEFISENDIDYCTVGQIESDLTRLAATLQ